MKKFAFFLHCLFLFIGGTAITSCALNVQRIPNNDFSKSISQQQPALSGDGKILAFIIEHIGKPTVQLRNLRSGQVSFLRHLYRYQPHSSPALSWSGRYLAIIIRQGRQFFILIDDRALGKIHKLNIPVRRLPKVLSLSPAANKLALQFSKRGKNKIEVYDISRIIEPDIIKDQLPSTSF